MRTSFWQGDQGRKDGRVSWEYFEIVPLSAPQHAECALEHVYHKENPKNLHDTLIYLLLTQIAVFPKIIWAQTLHNKLTGGCKKAEFIKSQMAAAAANFTTNSMLYLNLF